MKWLTDPDVPEYVTRVVPWLMGANSDEPASMSITVVEPRLVHAVVVVTVDGNLCVRGTTGRMWLRPGEEGVTWIRGKHTEKSQAGRALLAAFMLAT